MSPAQKNAAVSGSSSRAPKRNSPPPKTRSSTSEETVFRMLSQNPSVQQFANRRGQHAYYKALREIKMRMDNKVPCLAPRMDIFEDASTGRLVALFELPGLKNTDMRISLQDGTLHLQGYRWPPYMPRPTLPPTPTSAQAMDAIPPTDPQEENMDVDTRNPNDTGLPQIVTQEVKYGPFFREIKMPEGTKESDIVAQLADGMLKVTWPKRPTTSPPNSNPSVLATPTSKTHPSSNPSSSAPTKSAPSHETNPSQSRSEAAFVPSLSLHGGAATAAASQ